MDNNLKYKLVIFDLDGTLLDTLPDLAGAVNYALKNNDRPERTIEEVRRFISNGVRKLIERSLFVTEASKDTNDYTVTDRGLFDTVFADFVAYYLEHVADNTVPYEGMRKLVMKLKNNGIKTAVVTNKREDAARSLMDRFFPGCFDLVLGDVKDRARKPAPDSVLYCMECLGADSRETIYVGDSDVDLETADNARIESILVTWGYRSRSRLIEAGATKIVDRTDELELLLL
ncbi:MAG: HAD-IA family hydrolase [Lachnospiraceae bacterium]|nr:HAD-IA family hydrolase [Lachnospiraceae bacterium]